MDMTHYFINMNSVQNMGSQQVCSVCSASAECLIIQSDTDAEGDTLPTYFGLVGNACCAG